jgi:hypothetical protein
MAGRAGRGRFSPIPRRALSLSMLAIGDARQAIKASAPEVMERQELLVVVVHLNECVR